jgi:hypothetical protein
MMDFIADRIRALELHTIESPRFDAQSKLIRAVKTLGGLVA